MTIDQAITAILQREGPEFTTNPGDPPTKFGVTYDTYRLYRPGASLDELRELSEEGARTFYHWYLAPFEGLDLTPRVWDTVVDAAVLHGRHTVAELLQRAIGTVPDGIIGPQTLQKAQTMPEQALLLALVQGRLKVCRDLIVADVIHRYGEAALANTHLQYLGGWQTRILDVSFGGS